MEEYVFYALEGSRKLGDEVGKLLLELPNVSIGSVESLVFADGETKLRVLDNVKDKSIIILSSTYFPVNNRIMQILILCDGLKRAGAKDITLITPYFGYSRQDRISDPNDPITLKLVTDLYKTSGVNRIITADAHSIYPKGYFSIPVYSVDTHEVFAKKFLEIFNNKGISLENVVVLAPDHGSINRGRKLQSVLPGAVFGSIEKMRVGVNQIRSVSFEGEVENKTVIIYDDIVDTGQTVIEAMKLAKERGARDIYVAISHPIFSSRVHDLFAKSDIAGIIVANTIEGRIMNGIEIVSIGRTLAKRIKKHIISTKNTSNP